MPRKKKALPKRYGAPPGSKRESLIRKAGKLYRAGKKKQAAAIREKMEAKERKRGTKQINKRQVKKKSKR